MFCPFSDPNPFLHEFRCLLELATHPQTRREPRSIDDRNRGAHPTKAFFRGAQWKRGEISGREFARSLKLSAIDILLSEVARRRKTDASVAQTLGDRQSACSGSNRLVRLPE